MSLRGYFVAAGACAALLLAACGSKAAQAPVTKAAQPPVNKPALPLTGRVVDAANIIDPATEQRLTLKLEAIEHDTGAQFVVATTPSLDGQPIEKYSINLARSWGIGSKERNDGVLLLVAPNDRQVRIEVGTGLERTLPNALCARIIEENITPLFKNSHFSDGVMAGANALETALRKRPVGANDNHRVDRKAA